MSHAGDEHKQSLSTSGVHVSPVRLHGSASQQQPASPRSRRDQQHLQQQRGQLVDHDESEAEDQEQSDSDESEAEGGREDRRQTVIEHKRSASQQQQQHSHSAVFVSPNGRAVEVSTNGAQHSKGQFEHEKARERQLAHEKAHPSKRRRSCCSPQRCCRQAAVGWKLARRQVKGCLCSVVGVLIVLSVVSIVVCLVIVITLWQVRATAAVRQLSGQLRDDVLQATNTRIVTITHECTWAAYDLTRLMSRRYAINGSLRAMHTITDPMLLREFFVDLSVTRQLYPDLTTIGCGIGSLGVILGVQDQRFTVAQANVSAGNVYIQVRAHLHPP